MNVYRLAIRNLADFLENNIQVYPYVSRGSLFSGQSKSVIQVGSKVLLFIVMWKKDNSEEIYYTFLGSSNLSKGKYG